MAEARPVPLVAIRRSVKAWVVYALVSLLLIGMYGYLLYPQQVDPQAAWDSEAEWLGPAKAEAVRHTDSGSVYLLQMEESAVDDLAARLGCWEFTPAEVSREGWNDRFNLMKHELEAYYPVNVGALGRLLVSDGYFYQLDPAVEKELAGATPEEALQRRFDLSRMYGMARVEGGAANLLLCTWSAPYGTRAEDLPPPRPILPAYPRYHQEPTFPEWAFWVVYSLATILFFGGMNYIGNGFVSMLGGPFGWWRIALWFLLPLVGWAGFLGLFMLKIIFLFVGEGLPGMFLGALTMGFVSVATLVVSTLVSIVWCIIARLRRSSKELGAGAGD